MDIHFKNDRTVTVQMKDYLQESIDESGLNIMHEAATPAKGSLFDVDSDSPLLEGEEFETFQSIVAKLFTLQSERDLTCYCQLHFCAPG